MTGNHRAVQRLLGYKKAYSTARCPGVVLEDAFRIAMYSDIKNILTGRLSVCQSRAVLHRTGEAEPQKGNLRGDLGL
ncbi:MAG: hypothetical protein AAGA74_02420 [Pseudomonadota bacterium]